MNKTKAIVLNVLVLFASFTLAACTPAPTSKPIPEATVPPTTTPSVTLALVNGTLIDGTGANAVPDGAVVIKGGRIADIGPRTQVDIPADAQIIDVQGETILPGLIDAHVHYANYVSRQWIQAGVTTVRSLGEVGWSSGCREKDSQHGARIVSAGPIMTVPNGYPIWLFGNAAALTVNSPEEASQWTVKLLGPDYCRDGIKVALEGEKQLSDEELHAIVQAAHDRGTLVSAHVTYTKDLKKALAAGVDDMAHMVRDPLPDEVIDQMIAAGVYVVPTLKIFSVHGLTGSNLDNLRRFISAGGKVAVGTDYNDFSLPENMLLLEMEMMQGTGMTPMQVIVAATKNGAHVCNLENEIGTLELGKIADILVVEGDPLQNLKAIADVRIFIHNGIVIRNVN